MADGTAFLTDGKYGITSFDPCCHKISIPTLHIWDPAASKHFGRGLLELCDTRFAKEYRHGQGHEFPRGNEEIQAIVRLVRDVAEFNVNILTRKNHTCLRCFKLQLG